MSDIIVDVHNICSASGFYFQNDSLDYVPVVCFALVSLFDPDHPALGTRKAVVGLSAQEMAPGEIQSMAIETFREFVTDGDIRKR